MVRFTLSRFMKEFDTDEKCFGYLIKLKYPDGIYCPRCETITNFTKIKSRPVIQCSCGHQISPLVGTIFEKSRTRLVSWFYAFFLMSKTRTGISAKQLERELGVSYKCAWRMFKQIRLLMGQLDGGVLDGIVEVDETYIGGKGKHRKYQTFFEDQKEIVMGMIERNGRVVMRKIPNTGKYTLLNQIRENVHPDAGVITDQLAAYKILFSKGYRHESVNHSERFVEVGGIYTQTIESQWSNLKKGIYGVYRNVSPKYLQQYCNEFAWRYNHRHMDMFLPLLSEVVKVPFSTKRHIDSKRKI